MSSDLTLTADFEASTVTNFYYGGAETVDLIPTTTDGLANTTNKTFTWTITNSDNFRTLFVNVPTGFKLYSIEDSEGDGISISSITKNIGDRVIYYSEPGKAYLSNTYTFTITNE